MKIKNLVSVTLSISLFQFSLIAWSASTSINTIQNNTTYTLSLKNALPIGSTCNPSCIPTLAPGATQSYSFQSTTGKLTLDYDVKNGTALIGQITIQITPSGAQVTNGLGGLIVPGVTAYLIHYTPPTPLWKSTFTDLNNWTINNWRVTKSLPSWGFSNIEVRASSTTDPSPKGDNYLRIHYPAGSANSASSPPLPLGGTQFYGAVVNSSTPITLSYYLRFPTSFPFTKKVGKLPGLYSGKGNTGSNVPTGYDGWSVRFMWCDYAQETRKSVTAGGEVVLFSYGSDIGLYGTDKGKFIGCGTWRFAPDNKWHNIQLTIHLNDVGKSNGQINVCYDKKFVYSVKDIAFRLTSSLNINGILFQSFFGGSDKSYATPIDTYVDFASFEIYQYPSAATPGMCVTNN